METRTAQIRETVKRYYAERALGDAQGCGPCDCAADANGRISRAIGYDEGQQNAVPEGADLGLGCGNPIGIAGLSEGETVLDLGSGGGFDAFLAARAVGPNGRVIGVDMTPEMIDRARRNASVAGYRNVEFRLGEIENLPIEDASVDTIISNCVINLSTDKPRVFEEAFRVLRPGGRLAVSDIMSTGPIPDAIRNDLEAYAGCIAGAESITSYVEMIGAAGFEAIEIAGEFDYLDRLAEVSESAPVSGDDLPLRSLTITARRPNAT